MIGELSLWFYRYFHAHLSVANIYLSIFINGRPPDRSSW